MIRVRYDKAFDAELDALSSADRKRVQKSLTTLLLYFDGGPKPLGIGLRKLRGSSWEIRAGLDLRVLFKLEDDVATFALVGSHDDVRRALARQ